MAEARRRGPRSAGERLQRLLVMLPWLMQRREVSVAEMAAHFRVSESELVRDLELAAMCGLPPYQDELIDLFLDDEGDGKMVYVGVPRLFTKPFRLTAPEGFALLAAGRAALSLPGAEPGGPLARALDRLEQRLGGPSVVVDAARPEFAEVVARAITGREVLDVRYWSASSDETTTRRVVPRLLFTDRGDWYVIVDDERSGQERTFRVDRIQGIEHTGEVAAARSVAAPTAGWFVNQEGVTDVTLVLAPTAAWVVERYPTRSSTVRDDGSVEAVLPVASERWLARLLLRLGSQATVLAPDHWSDLGRRTARTVLARYEVIPGAATS